MSRLYRSFQTLIGSARIAPRLRSGQTVRVERVRIRKARHTTRFLGTVVKGAVVFQLVMWAIPARPAQNDREEGGATDTRDNGEEGEPLFIPFPLTTVQLPAQPYAASDPEWIEFVRISKDKALQQEMRGYMANIVLNAVSTNPVITMKFGKDAKITKYWMDIDYPYKAPPVYERSGLLITNDALEWATMPCDPRTAQALSHVLWPRPVAMTLWTFGTALVKQQAGQVARYFGFGTEDPASAQTRLNPGTPPPLPSSPGPEVQKALERIRQGTTRRPEEVNDPSSMSSSTGTGPGVPSGSHDKTFGVPDKPGVGQRGQSKESKEESPKLPIPPSLSLPWRQIQETYVKERRSIRPDPVRGSVLISGLVEIQTSKAWLVIDVWGWYDPRTKAHSPGAVNMRVRRVQNKVQSPIVK